MSYKKVKFVFDPIGNIKVVNRSEVLQEIADLLKDEILDHVGSGKSPVKGEGTFKRLNKNYADEEKFGDRNPNLDLTGDMLNNLQVRVKNSKIEVFVDGNSNFMRGKVEGHNQHDPGLDSKIPRRRFIPTENQDWVPNINRTIKDIINDNLEPEPIGGIQETALTRTQQNATISKAVSDAFKDLGFDIDEDL
jgi:hypothetical protein